jgi:hypothetical protein
MPIELYFGDHPPPHFHIITRNEERIAVIIESLIIRAGFADSRDTAEAFLWARDHRAELYALWQEYSEQEQ